MVAHNDNKFDNYYDLEILNYLKHGEVLQARILEKNTIYPWPIIFTL